MTINKHIVISFLAGAFVLFAGYQTYVSWQFQRILSQDHVTLMSVVDFINKATQANSAQAKQVE